MGVPLPEMFEFEENQIHPDQEQLIQQQTCKSVYLAVIPFYLEESK
jgi:hypothetical protein